MNPPRNGALWRTRLLLSADLSRGKTHILLTWYCFVIDITNVSMSTSTEAQVDGMPAAVVAAVDTLCALTQKDSNFGTRKLFEYEIETLEEAFNTLAKYWYEQWIDAVPVMLEQALEHANYDVF